MLCDDIKGGDVVTWIFEGLRGCSLTRSDGGDVVVKGVRVRFN